MRKNKCVPFSKPSTIACVMLILAFFRQSYSAELAGNWASIAGNQRTSVNVGEPASTNIAPTVLNSGVEKPLKYRQVPPISLRGMGMTTQEQLDLCSDLTRMFNKINTPMQCDLVFHPEFPDFQSVKWTEEDDFYKWEYALKQMWQHITRKWKTFKIRKDDGWQQVKSFEEWYAFHIKSYLYANQEGLKVAVAKIDLDFDGVEEAVIRFPQGPEGCGEWAGDGVTSSLGSGGMSLTLVLGEDGNYDPAFERFAGYIPFYYRDRTRLIKWNAGESSYISVNQGVSFGRDKKARRGSDFCFIEYNTLKTTGSEY